MKYSLVPKKNLLRYILGDIDQIDVTYQLNSTYNTLLLCLNNNLLDILYKYDQYSLNYESDQTDSGDNNCISATMEILSDTIIKFNITQIFIRNFSFYKEKSVVSSTYNNTNDFISIYPKLFLDSENKEIINILSKEDQLKLLKSKLLNFNFNTNTEYQIPEENNIASKGKLLPNNIELFTFKDSNLNYYSKLYSLKDSITNENINIDLQYDNNPNEDKYSSYSKSFNVINDSTIILDFEIYINLNKYKYLIDTNDININYHINVNKNNILTSTSSIITVYEKITNSLNINDILYIKDIYNDSVICICEIVNIIDNDLYLNTIFKNTPTDMTINYMDKYIINKIKNLENFNTIQNKNNILNKLSSNNLFCINDIIFTENDYLAINNLY